MKSKNINIFLFIFLSLFFFQAEIISQTIWECETVSPQQDLLKTLGVTQYEPQIVAVTIRYYVHVIRKSDGTGGLNASQVENAISKMESDFQEGNIFFYKVGESYINNDSYFNFNGTLFNSLIQVNSNIDAIDIYLLPSNIYYGRASDIPGIALVLGGAYAESSVLSHEMGHCLGLWHTHSGRGCNDFVNCEEDINGANCIECGDLVCDTPADPCLSGNVNTQCQYIGPSQFDPDVPNIMSYSPPECMEYFTTGQFERMFVMIENSSILQNVIHTADVLVTINQQNSLNQQVGVLRKWEGSNWGNPFNPGTLFNFAVNSDQTLLGDQTILSNQKYNNWNENFSNVQNHNTFTITVETNELKSNIIPTFAGVSITNILEGTSLNSGNVEFKDPWFIDYPDPAFGDQKRNRGMDNAVFKSRTSPFYPDYNTIYDGDNKYQGVFLDQGYNPIIQVWSPPYYSVKADNPITTYLNQTGKNHTFYFQGWGASPSESAEFQFPTQLETGVVFKNANAVVQANFKGTQLSNQTDAYASNSQRKFIRNNGGSLHNVYESMGQVWYENSTNSGNTWVLKNQGKPISMGAESKNPSLEWAGQGYVYITYQEKDEYDLTSIKLMKFDFLNDQVVYNVTVVEYADDYTYNASPVVSVKYYNNIARVFVLWAQSEQGFFTPGGLYYRYGYEDIYGNFSDWYDDYTYIDYTNENSTRPTMVVDKSSSAVPPVFHVAWQQTSPYTIKYIKLTANAQNQISASAIETPSTGSGFSKNYHPSITLSENYPHIVWIGERNLWQEKGVGLEKSSFEEEPLKEYKVLHRQRGNQNWSVYFLTLGNNVYSPSIGSLDDDDNRCYYAIGWSEDNGQSNKGFFSDRADDHLITLNTTGKFIQVNNSELLDDIFTTAFNASSSPYPFNTSSSYINFAYKEAVNAMKDGRSGIVALGNAEFYFSIGDVDRNGESVSFKPIVDSLLTNELAIIGQWVESDVIQVNNESVLTYSVMFGLTDSLEADNIMETGDFLTFVLQIVDAQTGEILGILEEVTYTKENLGQYALLSYEVSMQGIGNKEVKLQLKSESNKAASATLSKLFADSEVLLKSNPVKRTYNGAALVEDYALMQNYPNPFNPATIISYQIPADGFVTLKVYDILGKEVATLVNEQQKTGRYKVNFNASHLSSGVYIYELRSGEFIQSKKMMLVK